MSKKKMKKIELIIKREEARTRRIVRDQYIRIINDLYNIGQLSVESRNMLIESLNLLNSKDGAVEEIKTACGTAPDTIKLTGIGKKIKKKIKKYVRKEVERQLDIELKEMCGSIIKYVYKDLNKMLDKLPCGSCKGDSCKSKSPKVEFHDLSSEEGLKSFESLCENILGVPPEIFLGSNYKDKYGQKNEEDDLEDDDMDDEQEEEIEIKDENDDEHLDESTDNGDTKDEKDQDQVNDDEKDVENKEVKTRGRKRKAEQENIAANDCAADSDPVASEEHNTSTDVSSN